MCPTDFLRHLSNRAREVKNDSTLEPSKDLSRSSRHCPLRMTSVFMRVEGLDCFNQKPSSIVTSVFFITNRPLGAQFILDEFYKKGCQEKTSPSTGRPEDFCREIQPTA